MSKLVWAERHDAPLVWDGQCDEGHTAVIVGGIQTWEGKTKLVFETFACRVDGKEIGQLGNLFDAKAWCQTFVDNLIPVRVPEIHLWSIVDHGPHRRVEGCVYGEAQYGLGNKITTDNILDMKWDADGALITTADQALYRLCKAERTAALIAAGYTYEAMQGVFDQFGRDLVDDDPDHRMVEQIAKGRLDGG